MAVKEVEFKVSWENGNFVKMDEKIENGDWLTIVEVKENGNIAAIAEYFKQLCLGDITTHLDTILTEMMS